LQVDALVHTEAKPLLFMFTIAAPQLPDLEKSSASAPAKLLVRTGTDVNHDDGIAGGKVGTAAAGTPSSPSFHAGVCSLEGCGLGWRVRPPLVRRSPWTVSVQRAQLCIEAVGGAKIERVYTLLEQRELSPCISYEVTVGDLHAGDSCHVPVLVWLPALSAPAATSAVVKFSLTYVDAVKIDSKTCELTAGIARPSATDSSPPPPSTPRAPVAMERERHRVEAAEALQRAAIAANGGNPEGACAVLSEMEATIARAPATLAGDPLSRRLARVVGAALWHIGRVASEVLPETDARRGSSLAVGEKHAAGNHALTGARGEVRTRRLYSPLPHRHPQLLHRLRTVAPPPQIPSAQRCAPTPRLPSPLSH
jgi:hypothetical protein